MGESLPSEVGLGTGVVPVAWPRGSGVVKNPSLPFGATAQRYGDVFQVEREGGEGEEQEPFITGVMDLPADQGYLGSAHTTTERRVGSAYTRL